MPAPLPLPPPDHPINRLEGPLQPDLEPLRCDIHDVSVRFEFRSSSLTRIQPSDREQPHESVMPGDAILHGLFFHVLRTQSRQLALGVKHQLLLVLHWIAFLKLVVVDELAKVLVHKLAMAGKNMVQILVPLPIDYIRTLGHGRNAFASALGLPLDLDGVVLVEKSGGVLQGWHPWDIGGIHGMQQLDERHQGAIVGAPRSTKQRRPFRHPLQLLEQLVLRNVAEVVMDCRLCEMVFEIGPLCPNRRCFFQLAVRDASQRLVQLNMQITIHETFLEAPVQGGKRRLLLVMVLAVFADIVEPPVDQRVAHPAVEDRQLDTLRTSSSHGPHDTA
mmetsp:Transcript_231/g.517  ORF Transcript_231/g.517 Transcript_231/m.517 type:complete len:332 (-) Transcript_231:2184-3179(-)